MTINDFRNESIDYDHAQFAIAIALSQLGEDEASYSVLRFCGTYTNNETDDQAKMLYEQRIDTKKRVLQCGKGNVPALLKFFSENKVLSTVAVGNKRVKIQESLEGLLRRHTVQQVYEQTMMLLFNTPKYKLIVSYMDTKEFKEFFRSDVSRKFSLSADGVRRNDLSDSVIDEILCDFKEWIYKNSANGSYSPATCAPAAFLRNAFSMMYVRNDNSNVYRLLNRSGVNSGLGEDQSTSILSYFGVESKVGNESELNFIDVASKINRASRLLFTHNGGQQAFYDIFSCYRDTKMQSLVQQYKSDIKKFFVGCTVEVLDSASDDNIGHFGAVKNKKAGRKRLCMVFDKIVENGLRHDKISTLYDEVLQVTDSSSRKDGIRLFSTNSFQTKHAESNSEMLQIIVAGYLAVRELLEHLESCDYNTSIYNFPTAIFRDSRLLRRFHTLEEYLNYVEEISYLVESADSKAKDKSLFMLNDDVWQVLGEQDLTNDTIFRRITSLPLSFTKSAVEGVKTIGKDTKLLSALQSSQESFNTVASETYVARSGGYMAVLQSVNGLAKWIISDKFATWSASIQYSIALDFIEQLPKLMKAEGNPVESESGEYLLQEDFFTEAKKMLVAFKPLVAKGTFSEKDVQLFCLLRVKAVSAVYNLFFNDSVEVCSQLQFRDLLLCSDVLHSLSKEYCKSLTSLGALHQRNLFLVLAEISKRPELFRIPKVITSCEDFLFAYSDGVKAMTLPSSVPVNEVIKINKVRNRKLVFAVNLFFDRVCPEHVEFGSAFELMDRLVSSKHSSISGISVSNELLERASCDLSILQDGDAKVIVSLEGIFQFDEFGYALLNGERFDYDGWFILRAGYFIKVVDLIHSYESRKLTIDDLSVLRARLLARQKGE